MLRLVINNTDVELYENAPVNLKFQFSDVEKINNPLASYSQSFRVPLTQNNVDIFGHLDQVTEVGGLDLRVRLSAQLLSDTYPIMDGFVQVKAVYLTKEIYPEVELVFFSSAIDFKTELEGLYLSDLNLSSYNHDLTVAEMQQAWINQRDYNYGIVDTGQNWTYETFGTADNPIKLPEFTLFFKAKTLLDKIFATAGLTYESTYLEGSDFDKQFVMFANGQTVVASNDAFKENARTTLSANQSIAIGATETVELRDDGNDCFDQGLNFSNSTHKYTVPANGLYNINVVFSVRFSAAAAPLNDNYTVRLVVDPASGSNYNLWEFDASEMFFNRQWRTTNNTVGALAGYNGPVVLYTGDQIYLEVENRSTTHALTVGGTNFFAGGGERTTLEVEAVSPLGGYEVDVTACAPKMLQFDYLTSLQKLYNLVFIPDELRPGHFHIETFADYMSAGDTKDWSSKVDYGKDVVIKPTTDLQAAQYKWTYSGGKDFVNKTVDESLGRVYGQYEVTDTGNEFATGLKEVKTKFAPYLMSLVPGTATPILRLITQDGKPVKDPAPRIAYYASLSSTFGTVNYMTETGAVGELTQIPTMSNYDTHSPGPGNKDLNYGIEQAMYPIVAQPSQTLYFRFWAQYVTELYSTEARILTCNMNLTETDLQSWSFNDKIYIKDTYYRILSISYDANAPGTAQVELIRKLDDIEVCADTPSGLLNNTNIVIFNDSTQSVPDYGSKACCELYGYEWRVDRETFDERCRTNTSQLEI